MQRVGLEATRKLACYFVDEVIMSHVFAVLHNAHNASLHFELVYDSMNTESQWHTSV
jgi:hypothetical protein